MSPTRPIMMLSQSKADTFFFWPYALYLRKFTGGKSHTHFDSMVVLRPKYTLRAILLLLVLRFLSISRGPFIWASMKICQIQHTIFEKSQILNHFFVVMSFHGICNLCIFVNLKIKFHYFIIILHPKYVVQGILVLAMGMIFSRASGLFFVSNKKLGDFGFVM